MTDLPQIDEDALFHLKVLKDLAEEDPENIKNTDELPDWLKSMLVPVKSASEIESTVDVENIDEMNEKVSKLIKDLEAFRQNLGFEDTKELNTYFRVTTSLLEKLMDLKERAENVKKISQFKKTMLTIMDDEMDKDARKRALDRLREVV